MRTAAEITKDLEQRRLLLSMAIKHTSGADLQVEVAKTSLRVYEAYAERCQQREDQWRDEIDDLEAELGDREEDSGWNGEPRENTGCQ